MDPVVGATIHFTVTLPLFDAAGSNTVCADALTNTKSLKDAVEFDPETVFTLNTVLIPPPPLPVFTVIGNVLPSPFVKVIVFKDTDAVAIALGAYEAVSEYEAEVELSGVPLIQLPALYINA